MKFGKKVSINKVKNIIKGRIEKGYRRPVFLWGGAGVGKTTLVRDIAQELNATLIEKRLSNENPVTVIGLFYPDDKEKKSFRFVREEWMQVFNPYNLTIIFFDELLNAPQDVISSIWEIINENTLDGKPLQNTFIILASNPIASRINAYFNSAFWSRFSHFYVQPSVDEVAEYISRICSHVPVFLKLNPHLLYVEGGGFRVRANPRIWEHVARKCCVYKEDFFEDELDPDKQEIPRLFVALRNKLDKFVPPQEFFENPLKLPRVSISDPESLSQALFIIFSIPNLDISWGEFRQFSTIAKSRFPDELIYLIIQVAKKKFSVDKLARVFDTFITKRLEVMRI